MALSEIADRLYGLPPGDFTAARDEAAGAARKDGDRDLAEEIKALRRPSASAALVNLLARENGDQLAELVELGDAFRAAQDSLDGEELRALSRQRHQLIRAVTDSAISLGGAKVSSTVDREVVATLEAALADEQAAAAVRSGRLMRALTSTGLEPVELMGAVAAADDIAPVQRRPAPRKSASAVRSGGAGGSAVRGSAVRGSAVRGSGRSKADQRTAAAKEALAAARTEAEQTAATLAEQDSSLADARATVAEAGDRIAELNRALHDAKAALTAAGKEESAAEDRQGEAARRNETARRALDKAEKAVARLSPSR